MIFYFVTCHDLEPSKMDDTYLIMYFEFIFAKIQ